MQNNTRYQQESSDNRASRSQQHQQHPQHRQGEWCSSTSDHTSSTTFTDSSEKEENGCGGGVPMHVGVPGTVLANSNNNNNRSVSTTAQAASHSAPSAVVLGAAAGTTTIAPNLAAHDLIHPSVVYGGTRPLPNPPVAAVVSAAHFPSSTQPNPSSGACHVALHSSSSSSSGQRPSQRSAVFARHASLVERPRPVFDFEFPPTNTPPLPPSNGGVHEDYYNSHYNYAPSSAGSAGPLLASASNSPPTAVSTLNRAVNSLPTTPNVIIKSGVASHAHYIPPQATIHTTTGAQVHQSQESHLPMRPVYSRHHHYPPPSSSAAVAPGSHPHHHSGPYGSAVVATPYSAPPQPLYQQHYQQPPQHPQYSGGHYRFGVKPTPVLMSQSTHPVYGSTVSAPASCGSAGGGQPPIGPSTESPATSYHRPESRRDTTSLGLASGACPNGPGPPLQPGTGVIPSQPQAPSQLQPPPQGSKQRPSLRMPFMPWSRPGAAGAPAVNTRLIEPPNGHYQNGVGGSGHHRHSSIQPLMKLSTLVIVLLAVLIIGFIVLSPLFHYLM